MIILHCAMLNDKAALIHRQQAANGILRIENLITFPFGQVNCAKSLHSRPEKTHATSGFAGHCLNGPIGRDQMGKLFNHQSLIT